MVNVDLTGRIVYSKAGRDKDKYFVITGIFNDEYVYISDGDIRKVEKPKKKKLKHVIVTNIEAEKIKELLLSGQKVSNSQIKSFLKSRDIFKEV